MFIFRGRAKELAHAAQKAFGARTAEETLAAESARALAAEEAVVVERKRVQDISYINVGLLSDREWVRKLKRMRGG